jgi:hypothetical protein
MKLRPERQTRRAGEPDADLLTAKIVDRWRETRVVRNNPEATHLFG